MFHSFFHYETWNNILGLIQRAYHCNIRLIYFKLLLSDVIGTVRLHASPCLKKDLFPSVELLSQESLHVWAPSGSISASESFLAQGHALLGMAWIWLMSKVEYKDLGISVRCGTLWSAVFPLELSIVLREVFLDLYHN